MFPGMSRKPITRRGILRGLAITAAGVAAMPLVQSCAPAPTPTAVPPPKPAAPAPAAPTATPAPAKPAAPAPTATTAPAKPTAAPAAPTPTVAPAAKPAPKAEPVTMSVWWRVQPIPQGAIQVFEQTHPNIKINLGDLGEAVYGTPKYTTAVAAGKGPDIAYQNRHTFRQFASRKLYRPVEDLMQRDKINKEDFMAGPIRDLTWQGKLYGLPHTAGTRYFFWNRKHFQEAGLDPDKGPETWTDIEEMAPKLVKKSGNRFERHGFLPNFPPGLTDQLLIMAMENGAESTDAENRKILIDTDPWVEALTWCVNIIDKVGGGYGSAASFMEGFAGQPVDPFAQGKVAMTSYGNWMIETYAQFPDLEYDGAGAMPVSPKMKGKKVNWSCGWTFVIDPNTKLFEPGWEFVKWIIGPEYVKAAGTVGLGLKQKDWERQKLPGKAIFAPTPPVYRPAMEVMAKEYYTQLPPRQSKMMQRYLESEDFAVGCGQIAGLSAAELWTGFKNAWEAALTKKSTPKEALTNAKADVQKALDAAWVDIGKS
ncbi:MAG: extracellular solute-binding protein [Chloroflexi bacterium]|nr:extracellular solute-binding protein [Chloroflexota bacterium]